MSLIIFLSVLIVILVIVAIKQSCNAAKREDEYTNNHRK